MKVIAGATRTVFIFQNRFVLKVPRLFIWKNFLYGLLANMQEQTFYTTQWEQLCPVIFSAPLGFMLIMKYARPLTDAEWQQVEAEWFSVETKPTYIVNRGDYYVPVEYKRSSFGVCQGKIVAVDYGS